MKKLFPKNKFTKRRLIYLAIVTLMGVLIFIRESNPNSKIGNIPIVVILIISVIMLFELFVYRSNLIQITDQALTGPVYLYKVDKTIDLNEVIQKTIRFDEVKSLEKTEIAKYAHEKNASAFIITTKDHYQFCLYINDLEEDKIKLIEERVNQHLQNTSKTD